MKIDKQYGEVEDVWTDKSRHTLFVKVRFESHSDIYIKSFPNEVFTEFRSVDIDVSELGDIIYLEQLLKEESK